MDWEVVKTELARWFAAQSGIPEKLVRWSDQPAGMGGKVVADLEVVSSKALGADEIVRTPVTEGSTENTVSTKGHRSLTVQFRVEARDASPNGSAFVFCETARDRLVLPSSVAALADAGLALNEILQCAPLPAAVRDSRFATRAVLELRFNATATVTDDVTQGTAASLPVGGTVTAGAETITNPITSYPLE